MGSSSRYVPARDTAAYAAAIRPQTKMIWAETPTNPLLTLVDIAAVAEIARAHGALLVVDNTSPRRASAAARPRRAHRRPQHDEVPQRAQRRRRRRSSDLGREALHARSSSTRTRLAAYPRPSIAGSSLRGVKTLAVRMRQHCENAQRVAEFLDGHPLVRHVYYPGLPYHPDHELAQRQMPGFGGMVSFAFEGTRDDVDIFVRHLRVFQLAESLGGVESLCCHPASMTHGAIPPGNASGAASRRRCCASRSASRT